MSDLSGVLFFEDERNVALHTAAILLDQNKLDHLLQQSCIDINYRNIEGETALMLCLNQSWNIRSQLNLDLSIFLQRRAGIFRKLLENGADIDARDRNGCTALHHAADRNDIDAACMLLYYGIDVSILCNNNWIAFTYAVFNAQLNLFELLFNYYDDFSDSVPNGHTALYWAAWHRSPLAFKLVEAGADVNCEMTYGEEESLLQLSLRYNNAELFKLIWPKFDHRLLLLNDWMSFILFFIENTSGLLASDWVECMYLILESPVALDLFDQYKNFETDFSMLFFTLSKLKVKPSDRIGIITACFSLGLEATKDDINTVFMLYGFGKELELFIYFMDTYDRVSYNRVTCLYLLPRYIFNQEDELDLKDIISLLWTQQQRGHRYCEKQTESDRFIYSLGFFALPLQWRRRLLRSLPNINRAIRNRLKNVPKLPSLLELARNKARQHIKQTYRVDRAYHIHDVKRLNLPQRIRDIILFKTPLYK